MEPGQDQDESVHELLFSKDLCDELRNVATKGIKLNGEHCKRMLAFQSLRRVLTAVSSPQELAHPHPGSYLHSAYFGPAAIRSAVRHAISKAADHFDSEQSQYWIEVYSRIFAFNGTHKKEGPPKRWADALDYYNRHLNHRANPVTVPNRRRVWEDELLPPLVDALLRWNQSLNEMDISKRDSSVISSQALSDAWSTEFWWRFNVYNHLFMFVQHALWLIDRPKDESGNTSFKREAPGIVEYKYAAENKREDARRDYELVGDLAVILWLARNQQPPIDINNLDPRIFSKFPEILSGLQSRLLLNDQDADWLVRALDQCTVGGRFTGHYAEMDEAVRVGELDKPSFYDLLDKDPYGRLLTQRLHVLTRACKCLSAGKIQGECSIHIIQGQLHAAREKLRNEWFDRACFLVSGEQGLGVFHIMEVMTSVVDFL